MSQLLPVQVNGHTVYIEAEPTYGSEQTTSLDETLERAGDALVRARATVTAVATSMAGAIVDLQAAARPHEFTLEFGIKFSAEGSAIIAKAGAEANLSIVLKYVRTPED